MKIGVDIDCTMNQFFYEYIICGKAFCREFNHEYTLDLSKYKIKDQFQLSNSLYNIFMDRYFPLLVKSSKLMPGCGTALRYLNNIENIELYCVTSRDETYNRKNHLYKGGQMKYDTLQWFKDNNLPFNEFNTYFSINNKGEFCRDFKIDILIDDNPTHIQECIDVGVRCYFPIYQYNSQFIGKENTIPLYSGWIDIFNIK